MSIRIALTSIYVDDQSKALAFYTDVLGFVKVADIPMGAYRFVTVASPQDPTGPQLLLEPNENPIAKTYQQALRTSGLHVIVFAVDDIASEYARLRGLGVAFTQEPTPMGPVTVATLDDTCGNLIQLAQR